MPQRGRSRMLELSIAIVKTPLQQYLPLGVAAMRAFVRFGDELLELAVEGSTRVVQRKFRNATSLFSDLVASYRGSVGAIGADKRLLTFGQELYSWLNGGDRSQRY